MDAIVNVVGNNITAETTLNDLTLELKWSDIGKFPVNLLQVSLAEPVTYSIFSLFGQRINIVYLQEILLLLAFECSGLNSI